MSKWFGVEVGLRQGCVMSPWLFNMYMNRVFREINSRVKGMEKGSKMVGQRANVLKVNKLLYADDAV